MQMMLTARGSKMPSLSLPACILRWILPPLVSPSVLLMGNSCYESDSFCNPVFFVEQSASL